MSWPTGGQFDNAGKLEKPPEIDASINITDVDIGDKLMLIEDVTVRTKEKLWKLIFDFGSI